MQYDAFNSGQLFEAQSRYFREHGLGKTYEVKLLGVIGVFTTDPKNVHTILVTNFEGRFEVNFSTKLKLIIYITYRL